MRTKKPKFVSGEPKVRTLEESEMVEKAFYAGWNAGWDSCKKELERDAFIVRMEERARFYEMYKVMTPMDDKGGLIK